MSPTIFLEMFEQQNSMCPRVGQTRAITELSYVGCVRQCSEEHWDFQNRVAGPELGQVVAMKELVW